MIGARLWRHVGARVGAGILTVLVAGAILAPVLSRYDPIQPALTKRLRPPSIEHWFGTDGLGRDTLSRVMYGARYTLPVGLLSTSVSLLVGGPAGVVAGFYAGSAARRIESVIMRLMDLMLAFPGFLLALMLVSALGPNLANAMIAVGVVGIPVYARLAHAAVLQSKERDYVAAARACGGSDLWIMRRHVLPNSIQPLIVQGTLGVGSAILTAAGLSFLGLGAHPPTPEWGAMLSDGRAVLQITPWPTIFPGLAILLAVVAVNFFGDGLRDALDPRLLARRS
jgi:peptide/nickel transport system permease protein